MADHHRQAHLELEHAHRAVGVAGAGGVDQVRVVAALDQRDVEDVGPAVEGVGLRDLAGLLQPPAQHPPHAHARAAEVGAALRVVALGDLDRARVPEHHLVDPVGRLDLEQHAGAAHVGARARDAVDGGHSGGHGVAVERVPGNDGVEHPELGVVRVDHVIDVAPAAGLHVRVQVDRAREGDRVRVGPVLPHRDREAELVLAADRLDAAVGEQDPGVVDDAALLHRQRDADVQHVHRRGRRRSGGLRQGGEEEGADHGLRSGAAPARCRRPACRGPRPCGPRSAGRAGSRPRRRSRRPGRAPGSRTRR